MKNLRTYIYLAMVGLLLSAQLATPFTVHADGEDATPPAVETPIDTPTPPPAEVPTEVVASETPTPESSGTDSPTEVPAVSDSPTADPAETATPSPEPDSSQHTTEPAESDTFISDPTNIIPEEETVALEEPTVLEVLQELPEETSLVVLDENGATEPLATQEASEVIAAGDPIWCPDGVPPGGAGCTGSYATMEDLLTNEGSYIDAQNVNGTIWITSGFIIDTNNIMINGSTYSNWANYSLTLQGGWGGGYSVFTVPLTISNWNNSIIVSNLILPSLTIDGNSANTINNGTVSINNVVADDITVQDVNIQGAPNGGVLVVANNNANINIDNVNVDGASGFGLGTVTYGGDVTITGSSFTNTAANYSSTSYFPWGDGADIFPSGGNVTISNSDFDGNAWDGLYIVDANNLTINNSTFDYNLGGLDAIYVNNINITGGTINNNTYGVYQYCYSLNTFTLTDVVLSGNLQDFILQGSCGTPTVVTPAFTVLKTGTAFELNCKGLNRKGADAYTVNLPNGDLVQIFCPVSGFAEIARLDNTTIPSNLPTGYTYASAFSVEITQNDKPIQVITQGGYIKASFIAPPLQPGNSYGILYWDETGGKWIPLKDFILDENGAPRAFCLTPNDTDQTGDSSHVCNNIQNDTRRVISGVKLDPNGARVEVATNFPGTFVLVQH